jgi:TonB family protein
MIPRLRELAVVVLAAVAGAAAPLRVVAQTGSDLFGTIELRPKHGSADDAIVLHCSLGILQPTVSLGSTATARLVSYVIWRFDAEPADTTFVVRGMLNAADARRFAVGARSGRELVLLDLGSDPGGPRTEYRYDIAAVSARLNRLECVQKTTSPGRRSWPPPEGLVANPPPDSTRTGARTASDSAVARAYEMSAVEELPELVNSQDVRRAIERNYPVQMRNDGVGGTVEARFLILEDGRIDPSSVSFERVTHDAFVEPVKRTLPILHFRPARVNRRPVKVWVTLPIQFATSS